MDKEVDRCIYLFSKINTALVNVFKVEKCSRKVYCIVNVYANEVLTSSTDDSMHVIKYID